MNACKHSQQSPRFRTHLRKTFTFPAGPFEHIRRMRTTHRNSVVYAYENALLAKLDAVESRGFKSVRDARKELVVQIERALGSWR